MTEKVVYNDPTPNNFPNDYDDSQVDSRVKIRSKSIAHKEYGEHVREALIQGVEIGSVVANEAKKAAVDSKEAADNLTDRWEDQINGQVEPKEVIDARRPSGKDAYPTLGKRLDEEHNSNLIDDDLVSGGYIKPFFEPEIARVKTELKSGLFTFGIMTDSHYEEIERDKTYAKRSLNHIKNLLAFSDKADLLLLNGDNNNSGTVDLQGVKKEIETLTDVFFDEVVEGNADRFIQLGNHDDGSTRRGNQPNRFLAQDDYLHDDYFKKMYRTDENQGEVRNNNSLYFYKDYPDKKIRFISLNTSDIKEGELDSDGSQKYDRWGTLAIRQEQMNWFANVALMNVPADYHIVVTSHVPLNGTVSSASGVWNLDVAMGALAACRDGAAYTGTSSTGDYPVSISANYTTQGPRAVVGSFGGHYHTEWIRDYQGSKMIEVTHSFLANDTNLLDTALEDAFNVIQVDTANRHVYIYGFGSAADRGYDY